MRLTMTDLNLHTTQTACISILKVRNKVYIHNLKEVDAGPQNLNEKGQVEIQTHKPIFCDHYCSNRITGSFIVIHPIHNTTLAAGIIQGPLVADRPRDHSSLPSFDLTPGNRGLTVWITGLSGAGKTTICEAVHTELLACGIRV